VWTTQKYPIHPKKLHRVKKNICCGLFTEEKGNGGFFSLNNFLSSIFSSISHSTNIIKLIEIIRTMSNFFLVVLTAFAHFDRKSNYYCENWSSCRTMGWWQWLWLSVMDDS
jgi:hypothetical protein